MLLNDLYAIRALTESENQIRAEMTLHSHHAIFKGHFPGHPVLPGVCMMEMITEIMGLQRNQSFRISFAPMVKFLLMIDPEVNPVIEFEINHQSAGEKISVNGKIFSAARIFMKFNLVLVSDRA